MKKLTVLWIVAAVMLISGCRSVDAAKNDPAVTPPPAVDKKVLAQNVAMGRKSGDALLKAFQNNDFSLAKGLPVGDAEHPLTQERFDEVYNKMIKPNGGLVSFEYLTDLTVPPYQLLLWKVRFKGGPGKDGKTITVGSDLLFQIWVAKMNNGYRVMAFRFKL